jgi:uncharacterized protein YprB with RNaseH-like and TPR domain
MKIEEIKHSRVYRKGSDRFLIVERDLEESDAGLLGQIIQQQREEISQKNLDSNSGYKGLASMFNGDLIFLDIESCGLRTHDPIFMVALTYLNHSVKTEVLFARDFFEERAVLGYCLGRLEEYRGKEKGRVITYNGSSFDLPRLSARSRHSGLVVDGNKKISEWLGIKHFDLCTLVRARKHELRLPDCGLQTVTDHLLD